MTYINVIALMPYFFLELIYVELENLSVQKLEHNISIKKKVE